MIFFVCIFLWFLSGVLAWCLTVWSEQASRNHGQAFEVRWEDLPVIVPCLLIGPAAFFGVVFAILNETCEKRQGDTLFIIKGRSKEK